MASDRAWLTGIQAAAEATKNITIGVLSGRQQMAAEAHLESLVLALKAVTRPEDWDGVLDEVYRRAARVTGEEALESTRRDVAMGWRPGLSEAEWLALQRGARPLSIEAREPDLDDLTEVELEEQDPRAYAVASVLDRWYSERCCWRHHMVGTFLDLLAAEGYRVTPIEAPEFADVLPPAVD